MRRKKRNLGVLMVYMALLMMLLPVSEAGAQSSASDFRMEGSTLVKYRGTEKNVSILKEAAEPHPATSQRCSPPIRRRPHASRT